jgi:phospholipase/carboxylesterase
MPTRKSDSPKSDSAKSDSAKEHSPKTGSTKVAPTKSSATKQSAHPRTTQTLSKDTAAKHSAAKGPKTGQTKVVAVKKSTHPRQESARSYEYDDNEVYEEDELFATQQLDTRTLRRSIAIANIQKIVTTTLVALIIFVSLGIFVYMLTHKDQSTKTEAPEQPQVVEEAEKMAGTADFYDHGIPETEYDSPLRTPGLHVSRALWSNGNNAPSYTRPDNIDASQPIYILIHGYGGNEVSVSSMWTPFLHGKQWVAVRAPFDLNNNTEGYVGFSWMEPPVPKFPSRQLHLDGNVFENWVEENLDPSQQIIIMGHSQGGAMVTEMMRRNPEKYHIGISVAGFISETPAAGDSRLNKDQFLLSLYSTNDKIVKHEHEVELQEFFRDKVSFTEYDYPERSHATLNDPEVERDAQNWLNSILPKVAKQNTAQTTNSK